MHSVCPIEFIDCRKSQHGSDLSSVTRSRLALSIALTSVLASAGKEACKCSYEKVRLVKTYLSQNSNKHTEKVIENLAAGFS